MKITDRERKKYISEIQKLLVCSAKERRKFIRDFNSNIDDFVSDNPDASIDELEKAMGTPQEIADGFMANVSPKYIKKRTSIARIFLIAVIFVVIFIVVFFSTLWIDAYINNRAQGETFIIDYGVIYKEEATTSSTTD